VPNSVTLAEPHGRAAKSRHHKDERMRIAFTRGIVAASMLSVLVGCSMSFPTMKNPFASKKPSDKPSTALANAPAAPPVNGVASAPNVTMPVSNQRDASTLPVYPGTSYPVTPYPDAYSAQANAAARAPYSAAQSYNTGPQSALPPGSAPSANASADPMMASNGQAPAAAAPPSAPYAAPPQSQGYSAAPQGQGYAAQVQNPYAAAAAQPPATPAAQPPAGPYAAADPQTQPYGVAQPPATPYTAAAPSTTYPR
jgi:hypothetical protein